MSKYLCRNTKTTNKNVIKKITNEILLRLDNLNYVTLDIIQYSEGAASALFKVFTHYQLTSDGEIGL